MDKLLEAIRDSIRETGKINIEKAQENNSKFHIGKLVITDGVMEKGFTHDSAELKNNAFSRFVNGDWGIADNEINIAMNEKSIKSGFGYILGGYYVGGNNIWIKTDLNDDTVTTIMLPSEWKMDF